jgi:hypothetical protein
MNSAALPERQGRQVDRGPAGNMRASSSDSGFLAAIVVASVFTTATAIANPYLFMDEAWFIRSTPNSFDSLGRPLIGYAFAFTIFIWEHFGLQTITISRVIGTVLLSMTGVLTYYWLRAFRYDRTLSASVSVGLLSLPGFQILAATVFQIQLATVAALIAALLLVPFLKRDHLTTPVVASLLLSITLGLVAICTYQLSFNLIFVLLLIPILGANRHDRRLQMRIAISYKLFIGIVAIYYLTWKATFVPTGSPGMDAVYGPSAPSIATIMSQLSKFPTDRFPQIANLWYVESFDKSAFFYLSVGVVCVAAIRLVREEGWYGFLKVAILTCCIPLSDLFRLASTKSATYTSVHSISTAWWLICAWSIVYLSGKNAVRLLVPVVAVGVCWATYTTARLALRNAHQLTAIEQNLRANPETKHAHIISMEGNFPGKLEYGWTTGKSAGFAGSMVETVIIANHLAATKIGVTNEAGSPVTWPSPCGRPDLMIHLPSARHQCSGLDCRVADDDVDKMNWPAC